MTLPLYKNPFVAPCILGFKPVSFELISTSGELKITLSEIHKISFITYIDTLQQTCKNSALYYLKDPLAQTLASDPKFQIARRQSPTGIYIHPEALVHRGPTSLCPRTQTTFICNGQHPFIYEYIGSRE